MHDSVKLAPRQHTVRFESNAAKSGQENFLAFTASLKHLQVTPIVTAQRALSGRTFRYRMRYTHCCTADILSTESSSFSLTSKIDAGIYDGRTLILYAVKGSMSVTQYASSTILNKGDFLILDPSIPFTFTLLNSGQTLSILVKNDYFFTHAGYRVTNFFGKTFTVHEPINAAFSAMTNQFNVLLETVDARDVPDMCDGLLCFLRPVLAAYFRKNPDKSIHSRDFVRACAIEAMQRLLPEPGVTIAQIASTIGISPRYLSELFREIGTTVMARFMEIRLDRASVQLREGHLQHQSIAEISAANGFQTSQHFNREFKKRFGVTPGQWRQSAPET